MTLPRIYHGLFLSRNLQRLKGSNTSGRTNLNYLQKMTIQPMHKLSLCMVLVGYLNLGLFAQTPEKIFGKVNIASPNAASLGKYGDIPVSYHTGVPNITIPIYSLSEGNVSLPINISYHAGGLKVEEAASSVGAGWALNAGGVITRTVRDKPDERMATSSSQKYGYLSDLGPTNAYVQEGYTPMSPAIFDAEPDLFSFNFNGYSGKFYFNDDQTPVLIPEQDVKVEYNYTPGIFRCIDSFTITVPDGTKYYFGIPSEPVSAPFCNPIEISKASTLLNGPSYGNVVSSWYLNRIVSKDGNSIVKLNYECDKYAVITFSNPDIFQNDVTPVNYKYSVVKNLIAGVRLSSVQSTLVDIVFLKGIARQDLSRWAFGSDETALVDPVNTSSAALGEIQLKKKDGTILKKFVFSHDYFEDNANETVNQNFSTFSSDKKRLKLNSVQEISGDGSIAIPPHIFEYYTERVPRQLSFGRDHWGFINGVTTNEELYPRLSGNTILDINARFGLKVANREPAWPAMRGGAMKKITYPTGGSSVFEYEPNSVMVQPTVNGQLVYSNKMVGGLRIALITNFDPITKSSTQTKYTYLNDLNFSSGVLFSKPTYVQVFRNDWMAATYFFPSGTGCFDFESPNAIVERSLILSDKTIRPMETTQGSHIGYSSVKVSQTGNGHTLYKFHAVPVNTIEDVAVTKVQNKCACDQSIPNYPPAPLPHDFNRGELLYEGYADNDGNLLLEKNYDTQYSTASTSAPGQVTFSFNTSTTPFNLFTFYAMRTGRKVKSAVAEKKYQGGNTFSSVTETFFESTFHNQPTRVVTTNSAGKTSETRMKYTFDFRLPSVDNLTNCSGVLQKNDFMRFFNNVYRSQYLPMPPGESPPIPLGSSFQSEFQKCAGGYLSLCYANLVNGFMRYLTSGTTGRVSYINCQLNNKNQSQTNFNAAISNADPELKPILWAQKIGFNAPVETTEWKDAGLVSAVYNVFLNNRNDQFGLYPSKLLKLQPATLSPFFAQSAVSALGTSVDRDNRYKEEEKVDYSDGNLLSYTRIDGLPTSYQWGHKFLPTAKATNATNKPIQSTYSPPAFILSSSSSVGQGSPFTFTQQSTGPFSINLPQPPPWAKVNLNYSLSGPQPLSGTLCTTGSSGASCANTSSSLSIPNLPAGSYALTYTVTTDSGTSFNFSFTVNYQGLTNGLLSEFFFEGFEENNSSQSISGNAHTGTKYWNGNYTTSYTRPNDRNYIIQWWDYASNKWNFNQQNYSENMVLTGPIDDVRILPIDAQMSTFTYDPGVGMTSQNDSKGNVLKYQYDKLGRLSQIRDKDGKLLKQLSYEYQTSSN